MLRVISKRAPRNAGALWTIALATPSMRTEEMAKVQGREFARANVPRFSTAAPASTMRDSPLKFGSVKKVTRSGLSAGWAPAAEIAATKNVHARVKRSRSESAGRFMESWRKRTREFNRDDL